MTTLFDGASIPDLILEFGYLFREDPQKGRTLLIWDQEDLDWQ